VRAFGGFGGGAPQFGQALAESLICRPQSLHLISGILCPRKADGIRGRSLSDSFHGSDVSGRLIDGNHGSVVLDLLSCGDGGNLATTKRSAIRRLAALAGASHYPPALALTQVNPVDARTQSNGCVPTDCACAHGLA
jgi:hypothetical protein